MAFAVAGPAITAAPVTSTPRFLVAEHPRKRHRVMDLKERELMLANLKGWWASGRSTPQPGPSSASQLPLITHPVVLVPGPSSALAIPAAEAPASSYLKKCLWYSSVPPGHGPTCELEHRHNSLCGGVNVH